jgi:large subunit ribosomal protein L17
MRHRLAHRVLGRNSTHRIALFRNMTKSLIEHERIVTTEAKAKELRPYVERIITLAKKGTLHARRLVIQKLGPMAAAELMDKKDEFTGQNIVDKLFNEIGPRFKDRQGGYTRIIKRHEYRLGDAGKTALIELLKEGETKPVKVKVAPAPIAPAPVAAIEDTTPAPVAVAEEAPAVPVVASDATDKPTT